MNEDKLKHLDFIQAIIARMAGNSFLLKGWAVTLVAALVALAARDSNKAFALVGLLPSLSFWGLDAYYLRRERLFRCLYDDVRLSPNQPQGRTIEPFSLAVSNHSTGVPSWFRTLWSPSVVGIHGATTATILIVLVTL